MQRSTLLAAILATFSTATFASSQDITQPTEYQLEDIVVTATRFEESTLKTAGNLFVMARRDIERIPAASVPDLLSGLLGVNVAPLYGALGIDSVVNLRGAGTVGTGTSNTLVLLNGQRLNPIDSGSIDWSLAPLASIERIEVMPGSGTVMYGDRATGGVINIVTRKGKEESNVQFGLGSHGTRELSAQSGWQTGIVDTHLYAQYGASDGWRVNSDQERYSVGGRVDFGQPKALHGFVDMAAFNERMGMPGGLWRAEYDADPTQSRHPGDRSNREGFRIRPGIQMTLSPGVDFEADLTLSKDERSGYSDKTNPQEQIRELSRDFVSFSPKLRAAYLLGGVSNKATVGYEYYRGGTDNTTSPVGKREYTQNAEQSSHAVYLQNVSDLSENWFLTLGARSQRLRQSASQSEFDKTCYDPNNNWAAYSCIGQAMSGKSSDTREAFEAGLVYQAQDWRVYARTGTIYRFPNTDELYGLDPMTYDPFFAAGLKPQHGAIYELGGSTNTASTRYSFSLYQQDLKDEITSSDPMDFNATGNMNLASTRRRGAELSAKFRFTDHLRGNLTITHQEAKVVEGIYSGHDVPMVPKTQLGAGLSWSKGQDVAYAARLNYVGKCRYGDDYFNQAGYLDGYATLDLSGAWRISAWKLEARVLNATDKKYAAYGGYGFNSNTYSYDTFYYPADRRTFRLMARHDF